MISNPQKRTIDKRGKGSRCLELLGKTFGHLKVIYDCGINVHGSTMWLVQ
jgi:hypothetical protein